MTKGPDPKDPGPLVFAGRGYFVVGMHIIIGMPPHIIIIGAPMAIIEFMASQRSFMRGIIDASAGVIFIVMPSFVISQDILHIIGIMPLIIMGIIMPMPPIMGMPIIMPFIIGIMFMPFMPFIIGIIPFMLFIMGIAFMGSSSIEGRTVPAAPRARKERRRRTRTFPPPERTALQSA